MLNLLQPQHRNWLIFVILVIFVGVIQIIDVPAYSFGVSPPSINLTFSSIGEKCTNIHVYGKNAIVNIADYWSLNESRDIGDYTFKNIDGITAHYSNRISIREEGNAKICFNVQNRGRYYGLVTFSPENSSAEIGVWIRIYDGRIRDEEESVKEDNVNVLTGKVVDLSEEIDFKGVNLAAIVMMGSTILLFIVLMLVGYWFVKKKREKVI